MRQNELKRFPILHRFLAQLYTKCNIYAVEDMLEYIKNDTVIDYCRCGNENCSTVYLCSDRLPLSECVEFYNSKKGLIVMHFGANGDIEIEALDYENYPFRQELVENYNNDTFDTFDTFDSDLIQDAQNIVDDYFNVMRTSLDAIVVD